MGQAKHHAEVMRRFHNDLGFIPNYEQALEFTYRRLVHPGQTVVDVGAHSGRHTIVFAELVGSSGSVHAFEPLPVARGWIQARGMPPHVTVHPHALSTQTGDITFHYCEARPEESGLMSRNVAEGAVMTEITVQTRPLDDFMSEIGRIDFMKIDAEGGEIGCLKGAQATIKKWRPMITVEYGHPGYSAFGHTKQTLFEIAEAMDYRIGDLFGAVVESAAEWEQVCDAAYWDFYLVPREQTDSWRKQLEVVL